MIKDDMGVPLVRYTYNEWGVCFVEAFNLNNNAEAELALGNLNPFRYRGYYYDTESNLYYLMSRYYDPEIGQFISMDTPDYLAPETIGGVDLYAYGLNNPIMYVDPTGHEWYDVLAWVGLGLVIASAIALTGGVASAGVAGFIIAGAAKGVLIGAAVGAATGAVGGMVYDTVEGNEFGENIWNGVKAGFGIGAIVGGIVGASVNGSIAYQTKGMQGFVKGTEKIIKIKKGTQIQRYGDFGGRYMTKVGTSIEQCALTPGNTGTKTILKVGKSFYARTGIIAECEWGIGGGVQYFAGKTVEQLIAGHFLLL